MCSEPGKLFVEHPVFWGTQSLHLFYVHVGTLIANCSGSGFILHFSYLVQPSKKRISTLLQLRKILLRIIRSVMVFFNFVFNCQKDSNFSNEAWRWFTCHGEIRCHCNINWNCLHITHNAGYRKGSQIWFLRQHQDWLWKWNCIQGTFSILWILTVLLADACTDCPAGTYATLRPPSHARARQWTHVLALDALALDACEALVAQKYYSRGHMVYDKNVYFHKTAFHTGCVSYKKVNIYDKKLLAHIDVSKNILYTMWYKLTFVYTYIHAYKHAHIYLHTSLFLYKWTYTYTHTYTHTYIHVLPV